MTRLRLFAATSAVAALAGAPASAQDLIEEIVVTAEKRESTVQRTAVAVTALAQADLDEALAQRFDDLARVVPNLQMGSTGDASKLSIRGVGNELVQAGGDPGVALHLAGMYQPRPAQLFHTLYDLERVEVLRGPLSTLYGRNANGGTLNVLPARPDADALGADADVEFADHGRRRVRAAFNVPLAAGAAARIALVHQDEDGKIDATDGAGGVNEDDIAAVRPSLLWRASDRLSVYLLAEHVRLKGTGPVQRALRDPNFSQLVGAPYGANPATCAFVGAGALTATGTCAPATPQPRAFYRTTLDVEPMRDAEYATYVAELRIALGDALLTAVTGLQETRSEALRDIDASDADILALGSLAESRTKSQELRLQSDSDAALQWMFGAYWFRDEFESLRPVFTFGYDSSFGALAALTGSPVVLTTGPGTGSRDASRAAFGRLEWRASERLAVKAGLRYTDESKRGYRAPLMWGPVPFGVAIEADDEFDNVSGDLSVEYTPNPDALWYAKFARGFKSGGQNLGSIANPKYDEETVNALELGWKRRALDGRAQANVAVFRYDYRDYQVQVFDATLPPVGGNTNFNYDATVWGAELETRWLPRADLQLALNLAYLSTELREGINEDQRDAILTFDATFAPGAVVLVPPPSQRLRGNELPRAPGLGASLAVDYQRPLRGGASISAGARAYWQDDVFYDVLNSPFNRQASLAQVDAYVGWTSPGRRYVLQLFGRNLGNTEYATDILSTSLQNGGHETAALGLPRTLGIRIGLALP
ncbi:MAG: TonB-dependent receptor [Gammaproteobacteria bacterium]|nr:TonB-dependent receptor [Gammaproteobacteria bacterium]